MILQHVTDAIFFLILLENSVLNTGKADQIISSGEVEVLEQCCTKGRGCQIGMQGPQLCEKPRHFCKLDVATSRMKTLTYMFYNLPLQIQTIEGAL